MNGRGILRPINNEMEWKKATKFEQNAFPTAFHSYTHSTQSPDSGTKIFGLFIMAKDAANCGGDTAENGQSQKFFDMKNFSMATSA